MSSRNGEIYRSVNVSAHHGPQIVWMRLGLAWDTDPNTASPRRIWGLADLDATHLGHSMVYDLKTATPPLVIADLDRRGHDRFTFHSGADIWISRDELLKGFRVLDVAAPETYYGVPVPAELVSNWGELEVEWWKRGVKAAVNHITGALKDMADAFETHDVETPAPGQDPPESGEATEGGHFGAGSGAWRNPT